MDPNNTRVTEWSEYLNSILNHTPFGIILMDPTGNIILSNHLAIKLLSLDSSPDELNGHNILNCIHHIPALSRELTQYFNKEPQQFQLEAEQINKRYLNISVWPVLNGIILIVDDITGLKELEANSVLSIILGQENERKRLARDIHDGLGPLLSSVKLELDAFLDEFKDLEMQVPFKKLISIRETIDSITNELRDLSHHLLPRLLEEFGLHSAFRSLISKVNNSTSINIEFYSNFNSETRFNMDIELNLYRCGQELLNNAVKYARAKTIMVQVIKHRHSIVLMIEDDGIGFKPDKSESDQNGIGLTNVETRVRTLNGEFTLDSVSNKGTTVSIEIPL